MTTETYPARNRGGGGGVIVERDAELRPLPDDTRVLDSSGQSLGANDTIRPEAMSGLVLEASGEEQSVIREARQPVSSRLPVAWLVGLLAPIAAAVVAIAVVPRRRADHR